MTKANIDVLRVAIALLCGLGIAGLDLAAGRNAADDVAMRPQRTTRKTLKALMQAVDTYRARNSALPAGFAELDADVKTKLHINEDGVAHDGWYERFVYTTHGTHYRIVSHGRSRRPGGSDQNADITSDNVGTSESRLTYRQFLADPETRPMAYPAIASGVFVFYICMNLSRPEYLTRANLPRLAISGVLLLVATGLITSFLMALHVPSGH